MTEGFWPTRNRFGPMPGNLELPRYLIDAEPPATLWTPQGDQWTRTHMHVRVGGRGDQVHAVGDRWPGFVATACGKVHTVQQVVFTADRLSCRADACAFRSGQKAERPEPVDRPVGAYQCGARQNNNRRDATGNSIDDRTDGDLFQSVKSPTDNRAMVGPIPRAGMTPRAAGNGSETTTPVQARSRRPHGP